MGIQVSNAKATYPKTRRAAPELRVEITDAGGAKGFMAMAGFAGMEEDKMTDHGYDKTYHDGGAARVHEEWNTDGSGEYTVILGDRFIVAVHGSGVTDINALETAAAASVNLAGLEGAQGGKASSAANGMNAARAVRSARAHFTFLRYYFAACESNVMRTGISSLTSGTYLVTPKSERLIVVVASKPADGFFIIALSPILLTFASSVTDFVTP